MLLKNCDNLVTNLNLINTSELVLKTQYNSDKSDLKKKIDDASKKIYDTSAVDKERDYNTKINERECKACSIFGLAIIIAPNAYPAAVILSVNRL